MRAGSLQLKKGIPKIYTYISHCVAHSPSPPVQEPASYPID